MAEASREPADEAVYSKDYWDNVFDQVGRRPLVKAALVVLALLYASAIYAPLIANDRPFLLRAIDKKSYERALGVQYGIAATLSRYAKQGGREFEKNLAPEATVRSFMEALDEELAALEENLSTVELYLAPEHRGPLEELRAQVDGTIEATRTAEDLRLQRRELRRQVLSDAIEAGGEAAPVFGEVLETSLAEELDRRWLALDAGGSPESKAQRAVEILGASLPRSTRLVLEQVKAAMVDELREQQRDVEPGALFAELPERLDGDEHSELNDLLEGDVSAVVVGSLLDLEPESDPDALATRVTDAVAAWVEDAPEAEVEALRTAVLASVTEALGRAEENVRSNEAAMAEANAKAQSLADDLRGTARELRTSLRPLDPEKPDAGGVPLVPATSYPVLESTTWPEIFFMVLWAFVLAWPLWNRFVNRLFLKGSRERIRRARRWKWGAVLGVSGAAAVFWFVTIGGEMTFESAPFKSGLTSGEIVPERVVFPPMAMGFAETNLAERFRPPTWRDDSEISQEGYYVRGPRVPKPDPNTGFMPPPGKVEILYGEPQLNAPARHILGADSVGRDLLVRILYGGRISLAIGILSTALLVTIGVVFGAFAGYFGGWVDILISRVIEIVQSFPAFFLILTAVTLIPDDKIHPVFAITFFIAVIRWTGVARLVRGEFLRLNEQEFVVAAKALGFSYPRIIFRHVLPNALGPVLVAAAFSVAAGILTESAISFLGLGVKLPIPSWGSLINDNRDPQYWWIQVFPGLLIFLTVFCYNIVGEGVRDALDPRRQV